MADTNITTQEPLEIVSMDEIDPRELEKMEAAIVFVEPLFAQALAELGEKASPVAVKSWLLRLPSPPAIPEYFGAGESATEELAKEISFWLADQDIFMNLKSQIAEGFEEIIENIDEKDQAELAGSIELFASLIEPMIRTQGIGLTDLQILKFFQYRDQLLDLASTIANNAPGDSISVYKESVFRKQITS